jgi:hypothetical protein
MRVDVQAETHRLNAMGVPALKARYAEVFGEPTRSNNRDYLRKRILWQVQALAHGGLSERARKRALELADETWLRTRAPAAAQVPPWRPSAATPATAQAGSPEATFHGPTVLVGQLRSQSSSKKPTPGTVLVREYQGRRIVVSVLAKGFEYNGKVYRSLSAVRCAIYTRKSSEEGLKQEFNSLDAQREAAEAYIASQRNEGWSALPDRYDDGGFSGGNVDRPGLKSLMADIEAGKIDCVVVYKVDRLSRSLMDFARLHGGLRSPQGLVRLGYPALQHDPFDGPAHAQHPPVVRPVRA